MDATPGAPLIQIRDVSRRYVRGVDEVHALERVSLDIPTGHFVGFMGPSGSGKSTLLNLVSGIDRPSEGDVIVAGQRLNDLSEDELEPCLGVREPDGPALFRLSALPVDSTEEETHVVPPAEDVLDLLLARRRKREADASARREIFGEITCALDEQPKAVEGVVVVLDRSLRQRRLRP